MNKDLKAGLGFLAIFILILAAGAIAPVH